MKQDRNSAKLRRKAAKGKGSAGRRPQETNTKAKIRSAPRSASRKSAAKDLSTRMPTPKRKPGSLASARKKNNEAQLKTKLEQLEEFAHALDVAPAMVRTLDGKILHWGRGLEALYGWTAEEAVGRVSHQLLGTEFPSPLPDIQA